MSYPCAKSSFWETLHQLRRFNPLRLKGQFYEKDSLKSIC